MPNQHYKTINRLVRHGEALHARDLLEQIVSEKTRYLVLDLDNTTHYKRNMGEKLGWDLIAHQAFGKKYLEDVEPKLGLSLFAIDLHHPLSTLRYILRGARLWAWPGLFYLFNGKIGMHLKLVRGWIYRRFGRRPIETVQQVPRMAMMHHMSQVPLAEVRLLARRLWQRSRPLQVFTRADFAWLKARYPDLRIILSSASPQPMLEVAREELGIDDILYTAVEEQNGFLSAPAFFRRGFMLLRRPRRLSPLAATNENAGTTKVARLLARYPDFLEVETVGITDTSHGEDYAWMGAFGKLADVNSPSPFPPLVPANSPLKEIHSAQVLSRIERAARKFGQPDYLLKRRKVRMQATRIWEGEPLAHLLAASRLRLDNLAEQLRSLDGELAERRRIMETKLGEIRQRMALRVDEYNQAMGLARRRAWHNVQKLARFEARLQRQLTRLERPLARLAERLDAELATLRPGLEEG